MFLSLQRRLKELAAAGPPTSMPPIVPIESICLRFGPEKMKCECVCMANSTVTDEVSLEPNLIN